MDEMLTAKDLQALLQVDRSTIYRMAEAGQIPAIKVGKQWRFPANLVKRWLQSRVETSAPSLPADALISQSDLASLLPLECVQLIQDTFAEALGVTLVITDLEGHPITRFSNLCGFLEIIVQNPNALSHCIQDWHDLATIIDLEPQFTRTTSGLLCARALIRVGHELKGMVLLGGVAPDDWPPSDEALRAIATTFDVPPEALAAHLTEVFHLEADRRAWVLTLLQRIANIMSHLATERGLSARS